MITKLILTMLLIFAAFMLIAYAGWWAVIFIIALILL